MANEISNITVGSTNYSILDAGAARSSEKGSANGIATLGSDGKIPSSQLPSFVDDVLEGYLYNGKFYKEAAHTTEITAEGGKIYVGLSTNNSYRYSGSQYVEISQGSLVTVSRNLTSGTKVGTIGVDGTNYDLYCQTNTWRGIQDNLTSDSATDSLSAKQGKALNTNKQDKLTAGSNIQITNNVISATDTTYAVSQDTSKPGLVPAISSANIGHVLAVGTNKIPVWSPLNAAGVSVSAGTITDVAIASTNVQNMYVMYDGALTKGSINILNCSKNIAEQALSSSNSRAYMRKNGTTESIEIVYDGFIRVKPSIGYRTPEFSQNALYAIYVYEESPSSGSYVTKARFLNISPSSDYISFLGFTKNQGTITGIKMNNVSKGTSGVVDLGTVITEHQSLDGKQNKLAATGAANKPVYVSSAGVVSACTYELNKSVPSNAVFTDTHGSLSGSYDSNTKTLTLSVS